MKIIRLAIRTLLRFRLYTAINILGLGLSLACVMIIARYTYQELNVDHFNHDLDQIYLTVLQKQGSSDYHLRGACNPNEDETYIDPYDDPSVLYVSQVVPFVNDNIQTETATYNALVVAVDSNFFQILDYPLVKGNRNTVLRSPHSAVITETFARKIFGDANPIGQQLTHSSGEKVTIEGVSGQPTSKASFTFDVLVSNRLQSNWSRMPYDFVRVAPGTDINRLNKKNSQFVKASMYRGLQVRYQFIPLSDLYFSQTVKASEGVFQQGNFSHVLLLLAVGLLVLLVGVFNFVNMYTVVMLKRAREFGMKKVFGATTWQVISQLFVENMVMIGLALTIGWLLIEATRRLVELRLGIPPVSYSAFDTILSLAILWVLPVFTSIYPFVRYNYAPPVSSLRTITTGGHSTVSRTVFMALQYIITCLMVILSLYFIKQLHFMLRADLGYRTEDIIKVQFLKFETSYSNTNDNQTKNRRKREKKQASEIKKRIDESPLFRSWEYGDSPNQFVEEGDFKFTGADGKSIDVVVASMSPKYMKIFGIRLKEGRLWDETEDSWKDYKLILNETAQKEFGITRLSEAFLQPEQRLWWSSEGDMSQNPPYQVIGIVHDFQSSHLSKKVAPMAIFYDNGWEYDPLIAAIIPGKKQEAIRFLKQLHDETVGGEFEYSFVEDEIRTMYQADRQVTAIYSTFALIAILISSLGLVGLSLFDIQQRYREIALRKVNGAQVRDIILLLLRKYMILLGISFVIALPLALWAINSYMQNFAHKTPLSWWIFAVAICLTALISFSTLLIQIRKAAGTNPATILKNQ